MPYLVHNQHSHIKSDRESLESLCDFEEHLGAVHHLPLYSGVVLTSHYSSEADKRMDKCNRDITQIQLQFIRLPVNY
jgi:hypothetical protein